MSLLNDIISVKGFPKANTSHPFVKLSIPSALNLNLLFGSLTISTDPDSPDVGQNCLAFSVAHVRPSTNSHYVGFCYFVPPLPVLIQLKIGKMGL